MFIIIGIRKSEFKIKRWVVTANGYAPFCRGWDVDVIKLIWLCLQKLVNIVKEKKETFNYAL